MRNLAKGMAATAIALAFGTAGSAHSETTRALTLDVEESGDMVEIQLVANSPVTQQVEYELELVGGSRSRHSGNTSIAAGDRHVLSRLRTNIGDGWCATVEVTEASGQSYTLTAGDC
ncbi:curli-like amyloid fiber formation chaperone CsgH [uncultured Erythrobacter sp.]|uniref:curli-like amyloid fiber formation chaperone CsgH n=1 Tax=uncultured Erythrobacter sp. TaxID=263913 RepID=UPI00262E947F|nr:curli-like amyloid fiber formation chaperone CsgH [uncultured Erythrobacter sp.]